MRDNFFENEGYNSVKKFVATQEVRIPVVNIYPMSRQEGREAFIQSLKKVSENCDGASRGQVSSNGFVQDALRTGILVDHLDHQLQDAIKTGVLSKEEAEKHTGNVAEFPWRTTGRYARILEHEPYYQVAFSRNSCVISESAQQKLRKTRFAIAGLGVGTACGYLLALTGAEQFTICDGGVEDLHDHNRLLGADAGNIGLNQSVRWLRMVLAHNPYIQARCFTDNLVLEAGAGVQLSNFLDNADMVIEAVDSLPVKLALRNAAKAHKIPLLMATDLGFAGLLQHEWPDTPIFQGRLTQDVIARLNIAKSLQEKTEIAAQVMVGLENIPPTYARALADAQGKGLQFWPQPGVAAFLSASLAVAAIVSGLEGLDVKQEISVDLRDLVVKKD